MADFKDIDLSKLSYNLDLLKNMTPVNPFQEQMSRIQREQD